MNEFWPSIFFCTSHLKTPKLNFYTHEDQGFYMRYLLFITLQWWIHWSVSDDIFAKYLVLQKYLVQHFFRSSHGVKRQGKCSDFTREMCQDKIIPVEVHYNVSMFKCQRECYITKVWQEELITNPPGFNWDMMVNLTRTLPLLPKKCL